ncbi:MAG: hypothetical protein PHY42_01880 [Bacilli bacterium]|nr:hypothetical protein [Bacilli bacterium]
MILKNVPRYDMVKKPMRQRWYLRPLTWLLSYPEVNKHHLKVLKTNMEGLKPPYILLCTHHAFIDFKVTTAALFPYPANYVVAIDGFINREGLLRNVGCICKRKFTNDITLVKQIKYALEVNKTVVAIYPEARYSLVGTTAILPNSLGKMVRLFKYPVVVLNMHGDYLQQPVWNLAKRKLPIAADMTQIITQEEILNLSVDEINHRISKAFEYDEYQWQKDNNIHVDFSERAKGLHQVLYQCPHCKVEHEMDSRGDELWCNHCHKVWKMDTLGELHAVEGETEFSHIPDWYEFERSEVRKQIEAGTYHFEDRVIVDALPNAKGYIRLGEGQLTHDMNGFHLFGFFDDQDYSLHKEPLSMYSAHIEYDYLGKGDCIDLSTLEDTFYIYPLTKKNVVTKLHFATEELYKIVHSQKK